MNKTVKGMLFATAVLGGVLFSGSTESNTAHASEISNNWSPRTVEQIKAEISGNEYKIKWGDTLSAISEATNITVEKLAQWNSISNVDLIFAGNTISWNGNVATMENAQGDTISQAVIQETPADRVDPTKPIGGGTGSNTSNSGNNGSNINQGSQVVTPPVTGGNGSTGGGNTTTPPTGGDNGSSDNGTTTPPTGGDNGSSDNGTTTPPTGGDNGSGDNGTTTPPTGGDNGSGDNGGETQAKFTVWYTSSDDPSKNITLGEHVFETRAEAQVWIENYADELLKEGISADHYGVSDWNK